MASMGVRLLISVAASLSRTLLCFWTKRESLSGCFVLCFARCWPAASFWKADSNSSRISFEWSRMGLGTPASFATWMP